MTPEIKNPWSKFSVEVPPHEPNILGLLNLNWTISKNPIFVPLLSTTIPIPHKFALVREPENEFLDTCGDNYKVIQPSEIIKFINTSFDQLGCRTEIAGTAFKGTWIWGMAKQKFGFSIGPHDQVDAYFLITHPCVPGDSTRACLVLHRLLNGSTFVIRLSGMEQHFKIIDTAAWTMGKSNELQKYYELAKLVTADLELKAVKLAETPVAPDKLRPYLLKLFKAYVRRVRNSEVSSYVIKIFDLFQTGYGSDTATCRNTWWGAFQAVCYYIDYLIGIHAEIRFSRAFFGYNAELKRQAFDLAYTYAINYEQKKIETPIDPNTQPSQ